MKDEEIYEIVLSKEEIHNGCPLSLIEAAKQAAIDRNKDDDEYVITLSRSYVEPFLTFCKLNDMKKFGHFSETAFIFE